MLILQNVATFAVPNRFFVNISAGTCIQINHSSSHRRARIKLCTITLGFAPSLSAEIKRCHGFICFTGMEARWDTIERTDSELVWHRLLLTIDEGVHGLHSWI